MKLIISFVLVSLLIGCTGIPERVTPVKPFDVERYMGKWFEIARLDHSFERGLSHVSAEYTLQPDGSVSVINSGYSEQDNEYRQATGTARFVRQSDEGYLKVSFFGPFYGSYIVFGLDQEGYQYAFVSGHNTHYLWLLARNPEISQELKARFIRESRKLGFDTDPLIWVKQ